MSRPLHVVVADDDRATREALRELLSRLGHRVETAESGAHLVELCRASHPDLVLADIKMPGLDGIEAAAEVNPGRATPVILMSAYDEDHLLTRAGAEHAVMAYLVKPVKAADVRAAIATAMARFGEFLALRREAADLRQALEDRKLIERAKGVLMKRLRVDEEDAFRRLRKLSGDKNRKRDEVAGEVVKAEEVLVVVPFSVPDQPGRVARQGIGASSSPSDLPIKCAIPGQPLRPRSSFLEGRRRREGWP